MHNIYVFEDKGPDDGIIKEREITPSSELLLSACNGDNLRFLSGANRVYDKLCNIRKRDGESVYYIVFYDVSPNNINTINGYKDLVTRCKIWDNITIIPIICIEYYIIHMLKNLKMLQCEKRLRPFVSYIRIIFSK